MKLVKNLSLTLLLLSFGVLVTNCLSGTSGEVSGMLEKWNKITVDFEGPVASENDSNPNPFLDYRLDVEFTGPEGEKYNVPGYFAGDGNGGGTGNVWRVHFSPDASGSWTYNAHFVSGSEIAVKADQEGEPVAFNGSSGSFEITPTDSSAADFYRWGRLEYVGVHYFKFRDGDYWIKGGADSPENFLAYDGFDNTTRSTQNYDGLESLPALHTYSAHIEDWQSGDPDWSDGDGRGIIGALNYLSIKNVNSIYFLLQNIGGDGKDVFPWIGIPDPSGSPDNDNLHYDISKLDQWEIVFKYAQEMGIALHAVLNEAEEANKRELDNGELGTERKLFYREMIARFSHHPALQWNISEEHNLNFDLGEDRVREFAAYIQQTDPYDHPITVHSAGNPVEELAFTFGDSLFSTTSVQLNQRRIDKVTEVIRQATAGAGRPLPASMDEFTVDVGNNRSWIPVDDADLQRKQKLWPTYMSGGQIEFILEGFLEVDSFKKPEADALWDYTWFARSFMKDHLPFHQMQPMDDRVSNESTLTVGEGDGNTSEMGAQVFGRTGEILAIYYPVSIETGNIDLTDFSNSITLQWYNPRTGEFVDGSTTVEGGSEIEPGDVPNDSGEDWVLLIKSQ